MFKIIFKTINLLNKEDKKKFNILIILTFTAAILESIGLAAFIPIIEFFSGETVIGFDKFLANLNIKFLSEIKSIYFFVFILFLIFLIKNLYLAFFYFYESKFVFQAKANVIKNLFQHYIFQNYSFHVNKNSAKLIANLSVEMDIFENCLSFLMIMAADSILLIIIFAFIFYLNPIVSITLLIFSIIFFYSVYKMLKKRTQKIGSDRVSVDTIRQKTLQQSFDGIKEIIVFDNREFFVNYFSKVINEIKNFVTKFTYINKVQKILVEMIVIISLIFFVVLLFYQGYDISKITAFIGVYLLAIIKIIPSLNRVVSAGNYLQYASKSLSVLNEELNLKNIELNEVKSDTKINFEDKINLTNVSFKYSNKFVLENINFELKKNDFIGLVGKTGSGKSTLCNLLLGLIKPTSGTIKSDNQNIFKNVKSYQNLIGYVPQNIFLLDDTIRSNIAFGIDENQISEEKIKEAVKYSSLESFVKALPNELNQIVGEKGVKISGGEKQRIGIARALYRKPEILILDEPTSSLDDETEKSILEEILNLRNKLTVLLITHKKQNLLKFNKIFKIENNNLINVK